MALIIRLHLKQYKYEDDTSTILKKGVLYNYLFYSILLGLVLIINILVSCSFTYNMIAIGSGSMSPKIDKGDAVIYEKFDGKNMPKKGQILVFHKNKKIIVHRIIDVVDINEKEKIYYTKGDNNDSPDGYPIETKDIVGVVKTRIKYIGIPSVYISELIKK
jgi:signal peptidase I